MHTCIVVFFFSQTLVKFTIGQVNYLSIEELVLKIVLKHSENKVQYYLIIFGWK